MTATQAIVMIVCTELVPFTGAYLVGHWLRNRPRKPQHRCKRWVPLATGGMVTDWPYAQCALPANHPRGRHLVDPKEIRALQLLKAPF